MLEIISIIFRPLFFNTKGGISLDNIYSPEKVKIFKSKLMHFNHTQELQKFDKKEGSVLVCGCFISTVR